MRIADLTHLLNEASTVINDKTSVTQDLFGELRARENIIVYKDKVNAYREHIIEGSE